MLGHETTTAEGSGSEVRVRAFGFSDVGLERASNEDAFCVADLNDSDGLQPGLVTRKVEGSGMLFAVCDGVGGAAGGEIASQMAVSLVRQLLVGSGPTGDDDELACRLDKVIRKAGRRIRAEAAANTQLQGMGTTVTAAVVVRQRLIIGQIGDSRAYLLRRGRLHQLTKDQSWSQLLVDNSFLSEEEAQSSDARHVLLQALGTHEGARPDITQAELRRGDVLLLCSDGLTGLVGDAEISRILCQSERLQDACYRLIERACERGGDDNVTVVLAEFDGPGLAPPAEGEVAGYRRFTSSVPPPWPRTSLLSRLGDAFERASRSLARYQL